MSKATKWVLALGLLFILGVIVLAVGGIVYLNLSEETRNRLNPYTPKPPQGVFPTTIGEFTRKAEPKPFKLAGSGNHFQAYYWSNDGMRDINYTVTEYPSAQEAKLKFAENRCTKEPIVQQSDTRLVCLDPASHAFVVIVLGARIMTIGGSLGDRTSDRIVYVIDFENDLPYAAFGVTPPPHHSLAELNAGVIPISTVIEDFKRDETAATAKYSDKTFVFSATVIDITTDRASGKHVLVVGKPTRSDNAPALLKPYQAAKIANIKIGMQVRFSGRVDYISQFSLVTIQDGEVEAVTNSPPVN